MGTIIATFKDKKKSENLDFSERHLKEMTTDTAWLLSDSLDKHI